MTSWNDHDWRQRLRWHVRAIKPYAHYLAQREARREPRHSPRTWPARLFETRKSCDTGELHTHPVWRAANLTVAAREAFEKCTLVFWEVRRPGDEAAFALIVRPDRYWHPRYFRGGIVVTHAHRTVTMSEADSTLVATNDLLFTCGGSSSVEGLRWLCHALDDLWIDGDPERDFWGRPRPLPEIPPEDMDGLSRLAP